MKHLILIILLVASVTAFGQDASVMTVYITSTPHEAIERLERQLDHNLQKSSQVASQLEYRSHGNYRTKRYLSQQERYRQLNMAHYQQRLIMSQLNDMRNKPVYGGQLTDGTPIVLFPQNENAKYIGYSLRNGNSYNVQGRVVKSHGVTYIYFYVASLSNRQTVRRTLPDTHFGGPQRLYAPKRVRPQAILVRNNRDPLGIFGD